MSRVAFAVLLISLAVAAQAVPQTASQQPLQQPAAPQRRIPCKVPENAAMCYWTRGRLSFYNIGRPTYRMWKAGTYRILGIYSGPAYYPPRTDNDDLEFPANLERVFDLEEERNVKLKIDPPWMIGNVYADFEVCPLEPDKPGYMQPSCIQSARNIFVALSKRGYK